jgi:murein DD-endopeptidase MepM/ murein hydrolase activator NlpD
VDTGITQFNLNLRAGAGLGQTVITVLTQGTQVNIVSVEGDWLKVRTVDGRSGYVAKQFVTITPGAAPTPSMPAPPAPAAPAPIAAPAAAPAVSAAPAPVAAPVVTTTTRKLTPSGQFINVRATPIIATDNLIDRVDSPALITPLEDDVSLSLKVGTPQTQNQWIRVRTPNDKDGYVAAWLVKFANVPPVIVNGGARVSVSDGAGVSIMSDLYNYLATVPDVYPVPQGYSDFWAQREKLGLPDPFDVSPTLLGAVDLQRLMVNGFGPNTFAYHKWDRYYNNVCGMHNGLDHIVPAGTPLLAVSDGIIVGTEKSWPFLSSSFEKSLVMWCFLPDSIRDAQGRRMLSNVLVAYAHLSDNTLVTRRQVVKAGQVIAKSGFPINNKNGQPDPETNNAHLHLEVHLLSGDNKLPRIGRNPGLCADYKKPQPFDNATPFNPLLFFSPRLVKYHLHQGKKIGYGGGPTYPTRNDLINKGITAWPELDFFTIAAFQYGKDQQIWKKAPPWPNGIYDLPTLIQRIQNYTTFEAYPADFVQF